MTNGRPIDKRQEAVNLCIRVWRGETGRLVCVLEFDKLLDLVARDAEVREVLEGLSNDGCYDACFLRWMQQHEDSNGFKHSDACLAARTLWEKVQPTKKKSIT